MIFVKFSTKFFISDIFDAYLVQFMLPLETKLSKQKATQIFLHDFPLLQHDLYLKKIFIDTVFSKVGYRAHGKPWL